MLLIDEKKAKEIDVMKGFHLAVNQKQISLNEVWEKKLKKKAVFVINPTLVSWDDLNQREVTAASRELLPYFNAYNEDASMDIKYQYAEKTSKKKTKEGNMIEEHSPRRISWAGKQMTVNKADLFLYMFLNKNCLNSPFYDKQGGAAWLYKLKDTEAESEVTLDLGTKLQTALEWINTLPGSELRIKAKAMSLADNQTLRTSFGNLSNATDSEIKARLTTAAIAQPVLFYTLFNNESNDFYGAIEEAIDSGLIANKYEGGRHRWSFAKGTYKGREICVVQPGVDDLLTLRDAVSSNMTDLYLKIKEGLAGISIDKKVSGFSATMDNTSTGTKEITVENVVDVALEGDHIAYDRVNKTYNFIDEDGQLEEVIYDHDKGDPKKHKLGLATFLASPDGADHLNKIKLLAGLGGEPAEETKTKAKAKAK